MPDVVTLADRFLVVVLLTLVIGFAYCVVRVWRAWRWVRAVRGARWEPCISIEPGGVARVGVRKIARRGKRSEVVQSEDVERVSTAGPSSPALIEARARAATLAGSYNALEVSNG